MKTDISTHGEWRIIVKTKPAGREWIAVISVVKGNAKQATHGRPVPFAETAPTEAQIIKRAKEHARKWIDAGFSE